MAQSTRISEACRSTHHVRKDLGEYFEASLSFLEPAYNTSRVLCQRHRRFLEVGSRRHHCNVGIACCAVTERSVNVSNQKVGTRSGDEMNLTATSIQSVFLTCIELASSTTRPAGATNFLLFTLLRMILTSIIDGDPIFCSHDDAPTDRAALARKMHNASELCVQFCDDFGVINDLYLWLLYENAIAYCSMRSKGSKLHTTPRCPEYVHNHCAPPTSVC
jgi:hypothetical protein